MRTELLNVAAAAADRLADNLGWMSWNLFLALVPLALSLLLFRPARFRIWLVGVGAFLALTFSLGGLWTLPAIERLCRDPRVWVLLAMLGSLALQPRSRRILWLLGMGAFVGFLPNAPYVLTDIIHLIEQIRRTPSVWIITLALIPQYIAFLLVGFEAYVLSLLYLGDFLKERGWGKSVLWMELGMHGLSALGIYLGRFLRFNTWDILTQPSALAETIFVQLAAHRPLLVMAITWIVLTVVYWLMKQVSLGIAWRVRYSLKSQSSAT